MIERVHRLWSAVRTHRYETAFVSSIVAALIVVSIGVAISRPALTTSPVAMAPQASPSPLPSAPSAPAPSRSASSASPAATSLNPSPEPPFASSVEISQEPGFPDGDTGVDPVDETYPTPEPDPALSVQIGGMPGESGYYIREGDSAHDVLHLITQDLDRSKCRLTQRYEPDKPDGTPWTIELRPLPDQSVALLDGWHTFEARCPSTAGELKASVRAIAMDLQPEACKGFEFVRDGITVSSFGDLAAGVVGTWEGCAGSPGLMYAVVFTLRGDGTYSARSDEVLDGMEMTALGYGTDPDSPRKIYAINDFQASRLGVGQIDVVFDDGSGSVVRDELRNVRLMGDKLEFDLYHFSQYAVTFQLNRVSDSL
jgi:hypothetical protein